MFDMFDMWWGDFNLLFAVPLVSAPFLLSLQLLLCFKVESLFVRLFPMGLLAAAGGWFCILALNDYGWDGLGYTILAIAVGFMLLVCAFGWGIWAVCLWCRKRKAQGER